MSFRVKERKFKENFTAGIKNPSINYKLGISDEFNIVHPKEIEEFIKDKEGSVELINSSLELLKKYFPEGKYYLEFYQDYEIPNWNWVDICVLDEVNSLEDSMEIFDKLLKEFIILINDYKDLREFYHVFLN